jgi:hypothetical protein
MADAPPPVQKEPPVPGRGTNLTLRYLGIILPLVMTYFLGFWLGFGRAGLDGFRVAVALAAASWIGFAVALAIRRDWAGVAAITVFYALVDAWWWLLALGVLHFD